MKQAYRFWCRNGVFYVQFREIPGKWISCNTRDQDEAEQFAKDNSPSQGERHETLYRDLVKNFFIPGKCQWLRRQEAKGTVYRLPHINKMRGILDNYLIPRFGAMDIKTITRRLIDDWLLDLKAARTRQPLQADIKNKILAAFRHTMREAEDKGLIDRDPSQGILPYKDRNKEIKEIFTVDELRALFPKDIDQLLDIWLSVDWATYFFLQASCGLRPGEVGALLWSDWQRSGKGLIVSASIEAMTKERKGTKTGLIKPVPLVDRAQELLLLLESSRANTDPGERIFSDTKGRPVVPETAIKHFRASIMRAGLEPGKRTPYSFRHSFDTFAMRVLDTATVQELMGHKTLKMTMDTYYHPTDKERLEALPEGIGDRLGKIWE